MYIAHLDDHYWQLTVASGMTMLIVWFVPTVRRRVLRSVLLVMFKYTRSGRLSELQQRMIARNI